MKTFMFLAWMACVPGPVLAQAIGGSASDSSGAPVPGVLVEAASPALIEKSRTAVTDSTGQYRIEDLRPGMYTVRFSLEHWNTVQREHVELTGSITAIVNAVLTVGPLTETVTVSGESPIVDVRSARHEVTLTGELVRSVPTVRSYNALLVLVPGVLTNTNDTVTGTASTSFPIHGGRTNESRLTLDGLNIGSPPSGNSATSYVVDTGNAQEVTFTTSGALGETETAGVVMNIVPKTGGNAFESSFFGTMFITTPAVSVLAES